MGSVSSGGPTRSLVEVLPRDDGQFEVRHNGLVIFVGSRERALAVAKIRAAVSESSEPSDAAWRWLQNRR